MDWTEPSLDPAAEQKFDQTFGLPMRRFIPTLLRVAAIKQIGLNPTFLAIHISPATLAVARPNPLSESGIPRLKR